ncbi:MAG: trehalose utilization protein ThuA [Planctomycetes bacterium]|nr:trehalose utilization protein ThuA [Planctomycetota bacterium]
MSSPIRVTVWNEYRHEKRSPAIAAIYPEGIHGTLAAALSKHPDMAVRTATLDEPEHGLTDEVLAATDVMLWWGHCAHGEVSDAVVAKVRRRVLEGMGLVVLHSGHYSKIFKALMGTTCSLCWREVGEQEVLWVADPSHPIAEGIGTCIILPNTEMYGEPFGIPVPEEQVFISSFAGGEVFRSGNVWRRGAGRIFYFRPGHESYPIFHNEQVLRVITNAVRYCRPTAAPVADKAPNVPMGWFRKG